ncbi:hypothetical protein Celaphus_00016736, partial [Cervus elaphus hippelaphus]
CICQALREKITILVTHQLQYLKAASQILILENGEMVQEGTYSEFMKSWVYFDTPLKKENEEAEPSPGPGTLSLRNRTSSESSVQSQQASTPLLKDAAPEGQDTYKNYFTAGAHWLTMVFLILVNITAQVAYALQDWWLADWANEQSALYGMVYGKGNITVVRDPVWYFQTYSGKVESSGLLHESL